MGILSLDILIKSFKQTFKKIPFFLYLKDYRAKIDSVVISLKVHRPPWTFFHLNICGRIFASNKDLIPVILSVPLGFEIKILQIHVGEKTFNKRLNVYLFAFVRLMNRQDVELSIVPGLF